MYGPARDLKEALLGRQPKVFFLFSLFFLSLVFILSGVCFSVILFPLVFHALFVYIEGNVLSKHVGGIFLHELHLSLGMFCLRCISIAFRSCLGLHLGFRLHLKKKRPKN